MRIRRFAVHIANPPRYGENINQWKSGSRGLDFILQTIKKKGKYQLDNPLSENTEKQLHVFENEASESIIAYDAQDAIKVWEETIGDIYDIEDGSGEFDKVSDDKQYTLYEEETINPKPIPEGAVLVSSSEFSHTYKATCRDWAIARGRCYLGSTEY